MCLESLIMLKIILREINHNNPSGNKYNFFLDMGIASFRAPITRISRKSEISLGQDKDQFILHQQPLEFVSNFL